MNTNRLSAAASQNGQPHEPGDQSTRRDIDRLACGDLPEDRRRALFAWLEAEPARWRSVGLAFLETQTWEESLAGLTPPRAAHEGASPAPIETLPSPLAIAPFAAPTASPVAVSQRRLHSRLVLAASLAVAFGIGLGIGRGGSSPRIAVAPDANQPIADDGATDVAAEPRLRQVGTLSMWVEGSPDSKKVQLPVLEGQGVEEFMSRQAPVVSAEVRKRLERSGYRLQEERQFIPFKLRDGRQVVVPVDRWQLSYVGPRAT